jgi:AbrB family looped-hinge helix DNA binding protein
MQVEDVVLVSSKGQIVLPKRIRQRLGIEPGKKLLVATYNDSILLKKLEDISLEEVSERTSKVVEEERIDVSTLVDEAIQWARKGRRKRLSD